MRYINWECKVFTNFSEENQGCKLAVTRGIDWFFDNEDEGIILEDDCLPNIYFYEFCKVLLEKYRNDNRFGRYVVMDIKIKIPLQEKVTF